MHVRCHLGEGALPISLLRCEPELHECPQALFGEGRLSGLEAGEVQHRIESIVEQPGLWALVDAWLKGRGEGRDEEGVGNEGNGGSATDGRLWEGMGVWHASK